MVHVAQLVERRRFRPDPVRVRGVSHDTQLGGASGVAGNRAYADRSEAAGSNPAMQTYPA